jgi:antitoxin component YwqK of YwqJK toxin-antitoxin module
MGEQDKKHGYSAELVRLVEKDTTYEEEFYNNGKPKYLKTTKTGRDGIVITIDWKKIIKWYENGQKKYEGNLKDGKLLYTTVTCDVNDWTCFELNFFKP